MNTTTKTLRGKLDASQRSDRGDWVQTGGPAGWVSYYVPWELSPGLRRDLLPNTPVEFELGTLRNRPVAINVRRIILQGANHADR